MLWKILFGVTLALALAHQFCHCDEHTFGTYQGGKLLYNKELFNQVQDEGFARSKNYTLIFKYINSKDSVNVTYAVFNVQNAKSYGNVEFTLEDDKKTLQAMLNIVNGTNVVVSAKIYGSGVTVYGSGGMVHSIESKTPKTMTVIYGHNSTRTRDHKIVLGHRQPGDEQLHFEQKIVEFKFNFAEAEFKYPIHDEPKPTASITAVEFSFDTLSAVAFLNSTFITEHRIDAIVYDLNVPAFGANMTVYGYRNNKPSGYKPIVLTGKNEILRT